MIEAEQIAPKALKTTSISSTARDIATIIRYIRIVYPIKYNFAFFFLFSFFYYFINVLISSICPLARHYYAFGASFTFIKANLIKAMKLFRHPKNRIGKAQKIETKKLAFKRKKKGFEKVS